VAPAHLIYDDDCGFCRWSAERIRAWDRAGRVRFEPLGGRAARELLAPVPPEDRPRSWHLVERDGRVWSGGTAVAPLLRMLPGGAPLAAVAAACPSTTARLYGVVARHRGSLGRLLGRDACAVDPSRGVGGGSAA
jgi:predicted DCC family thiol-disulfide oxidoreductase YuxK